MSIRARLPLRSQRNWAATAVAGAATAAAVLFIGVASHAAATGLPPAPAAAALMMGHGKESSHPRLQPRLRLARSEVIGTVSQDWQWGSTWPEEGAAQDKDVDGGAAGDKGPGTVMVMAASNGEGTSMSQNGASSLPEPAESANRSSSSSSSSSHYGLFERLQMELDDAKLLWENAVGAGDYDVTMQTNLTTGCDPQGQDCKSPPPVVPPKIRTYVRDGAVVVAIQSEADGKLVQVPPSDARTIQDLFQSVQEAIDSRTTVDAEYDANLGFPTYVLLFQGNGSGKNQDDAGANATFSVTQVTEMIVKADDILKFDPNFDPYWQASRALTVKLFQQAQGLWESFTLADYALGVQLGDRREPVQTVFVLPDPQKGYPYITHVEIEATGARIEGQDANVPTVLALFDILNHVLVDQDASATTHVEATFDEDFGYPKFLNMSRDGLDGATDSNTGDVLYLTVWLSFLTPFPIMQIELDKAVKLWSALGSHNYNMLQTYVDVKGHSGEQTLKVRNNTQSDESIDNGAEVNSRAQFYTISDIFELIQQVLDSKTAQTRIEYDSVLGYPVVTANLINDRDIRYSLSISNVVLDPIDEDIVTDRDKNETGADGGVNGNDHTFENNSTDPDPGGNATDPGNSTNDDNNIVNGTDDGTAGNETVDSTTGNSPGDGTGSNFDAFLGGDYALDEDANLTFSEAMSLWDAWNITDYSFSFEAVNQSSKIMVINVRYDNETGKMDVYEAKDINDIDPLSFDPDIQYLPTVSRLMDMIYKAKLLNASDLDVVYDSKYGYPKFLNVSMDGLDDMTRSQFFSFITGDGTDVDNELLLHMVIRVDALVPYSALQAELDVARAIWDSHNLTEYNAFYQKVCACPQASQVRKHIHISNGTDVDSVISAMSGRSMALFEAESVQKIFDYMQMAIINRFAAIRVRFHRTLGSPEILVTQSFWSVPNMTVVRFVQVLTIPEGVSNDTPVNSIDGFGVEESEIMDEDGENDNGQIGYDGDDQKQTLKYSRDLWNSWDVTDYAYSIVPPGGDLLAFSVKMNKDTDTEIQVVQGEASTTKRSIDDVFDIVDQAIARGASFIRAYYDNDFGYPLFVNVSFDGDLAVLPGDGSVVPSSVSNNIFRSSVALASTADGSSNVTFLSISIESFTPYNVIQRELDEAKSLWNLPNYDASYRMQCYCPYAYQVPKRIQVRNDTTLATVINTGTGSYAPTDAAMTVHGLFELIQESIDRRYALLHAVFNDTFGYPEQILSKRNWVGESEPTFVKISEVVANNTKVDVVNITTDDNGEGRDENKTEDDGQNFGTDMVQGEDGVWRAKDSVKNSTDEEAPTDSQPLDRDSATMAYSRGGLWTVATAAAGACFLLM